MKRVAFLMFVLALLAPQVLGASYEPKGPKEKTEKEKSQIIPVPEPAMITLLAAGAGGVAIARKFWKNRQS